MSKAYPKYYLQKTNGSSPQLWRIEEAEAYPLTPWHSKRPVITGVGKELWELDDGSGRTKDQFVETELSPGQFYPRIARPSAYYEPFGCPVCEDDTFYIAEALGQLGVFCRDLDAVCRTVQPTEANFKVYGHDIRNLLILACTEVEAHWKGVLRLHNRNGRTTNDYVLLHRPLRLDEYNVRFTSYPWLPSINPFRGWGAGSSPTEDLPWYSAYNGVKHNRENEFSRATLEHAFNAVTACAIMLVAQFGLRGLGYIDDSRPGMFSYFAFESSPEWPLEEHYIDFSEPSGTEPAPVPYPW